MIFLFRIISDESPDFFMDLVVGDTDTFLEFHNALQKELGYDASQLASFFLTNHHWEKELEITLIDMSPEPGVETYTMDQVCLGEHIRELNQRMIYLFDFFSDRAFFIEMIEKSDEISPRETPFIGHSKGDPPPQLALDKLMDDPPLYADPDPTDDPDPMDDPDNLRIDDLDPDMLDSGMPEDY